MMRTVLLGLLVAVAALMVVDRATRPTAPAASRAHFVIAPPPPPPSVQPALPPVVEPVSQDASSSTPTLDMMARLEVRRRLAREGDGVYLDSLFTHTDSVVTRWPDSSTLRVALVADTTIKGWTPAMFDEARAGMAAWDDNDPGIRFREVSSPDSADIVVRWAVTLPDTTEAGVTQLSWDANGVARSAAITLALCVKDTIAVPRGQRIRVAAHEFGHALGLPHSDRDDDLMYRTSPVDRPSDRDLATLQLLYAVMPGPLKIR